MPHQYAEDLSLKELEALGKILEACETRDQGQQAGILLTEDEFKKRFDDDLPSHAMVELGGRIVTGRNSRKSGWTWL